MSRQPKIRITNEDRIIIEKINTNVRAKQRRIKKNYDINVPMTIKGVESFKTRKEFNAYVERMQSFTNRYNLNYQYVKNKHGVVITKLEYNQLKRKADAVTRNRKKELKKVVDKPQTLRGEGTGFTVGESNYRMGDMRLQHLQPFKFNFETIDSKTELNKLKDKLNNQSKPKYLRSKNELFKANYILALENTFNSKADNLINHVMKMTGSEFYKMYIQEELITIEFIYDPLEAEVKIAELESIFGIDG
ncbi:hypothetical protein [Bacillus altitudinis]|uniref:hypothetical protein n=1 Tax=Bacillus altitudinis TaxID=293387 RepID=UPI003D1BE687